MSYKVPTRSDFDYREIVLRVNIGTFVPYEKVYTDKNKIKTKNHVIEKTNKFVALLRIQKTGLV